MFQNNKSVLAGASLLPAPVASFAPEHEENLLDENDRQDALLQALDAAIMAQNESELLDQNGFAPATESTIGTIEPTPIDPDAINIVNELNILYPNNSILFDEDNDCLELFASTFLSNNKNSKRKAQNDNVGSSFHMPAEKQAPSTQEPSTKKQRLTSFTSGTTSNAAASQNPPQPKNVPATVTSATTFCSDLQQSFNSDILAGPEETLDEIFRDHHTKTSDKWFEKFDQLRQFKEDYGHCMVPHDWKENVALAQWVKRQRRQYKMKYQGKHSTLTEEREQSLKDLGFVFDSHGTTWEERLAELCQFKEVHGHCNVPGTYSENPRLAIWVKCQRRQWKLYLTKGPQKSSMTYERYMKLSELNFSWSPRNS